MDPVRLQIENFCSHSKSDISFSDFSSALVIAKIKGNDKFSNGAGKSTIFSAIKYVLFNEVDFSTLDKAIRHGTDFCKITFDFCSVYDGETYRIVRSKNKRIGSEIRLYKQVNDAWEDLTQRRNQDTEKEITKIIKINYKTFCNSVLFAQSDLSGLASLTPEKRKLALKEALQLNVYSKYEAAAKKKSADLVKDIDREKTILKTIGTPVEDIGKFNKELEELDNVLSEKYKNLTFVKNNCDKEREKYLTLTQKFETLERQSTEFVSKQKNLQEETKKITETISDYDKKISALGESGKALKDEVKELLAHLGRMQSIKLRDKETIKNDIENSTQELINKKALYSAQLTRLDELKIPLPVGSTCKYCRQEMKDRDACQKAIDLEIAEKEQVILSHKKELDILDNFNKKFKEELKVIESSETRILSLKADLSAKSKEIESKRSLYSEYSELSINNKNLLVKKNKELDEIRKNQFIDNVEEFSKLKINISNIKSKINLFSLELEDTNKLIASLSNNKAVLLHRIEERQKDIIKIDTCLSTISDLEEKYSIYQKAVQAFGSTGIPALITHTILDDFQSETNFWLSRLRPGLQLQFSVVKDRSDGDKEDTLDIEYVLNGYDVEHAQLSGAQKFIVALALKLGLASIIKKRLGVEVGLFLIDEVDQSIDEGGLEAFEESIRQLQQDFKVLVITHNNDLKAKFNHAILVEQDEKFVSTAKVVSTW